MKKVKRQKLNQRQALSLLVATVNSVNNFAPLSTPVAATLAEIPLPRRITLDEALQTSFSRSGQVLERLLFTTAYAAYTPIVENGASVSNETVDSPIQLVSSGGTAISTTVVSGGVQDVYSGGKTSGTMLAGGSQTVYGGDVIATTIASGGTQTVFLRQAVTATRVHSGGVLDMFGYEGSATDTILEAGYVVRVDTNNTLTTADGSVSILGGIATSVTVNSGGSLEVLSGADQASFTTVNSGGGMYVDNGRAIFTTVNGGYQAAFGGIVSATTVRNGGFLEVNDSGTVSATTVGSDGRMEVYRRHQFVPGGTAVSTTVNSGGSMTVYDGVVISTTVNSGGSMIVSGGSVTATTLAGGNQEVYGSVSNTSITSNGIQNIYGGGRATDTTIFDAAQNVSGGATTSVTIVNSGGVQNVFGGGNAISTTVTNGGIQYVQSGGTVSDVNVNSGGFLNIADGAQISGTTRINGATVAISGSTSGSYNIASLSATGATVRLANADNMAGRSLTITNLSGSAKFIINTDLTNGTADNIIVGSATSSSVNMIQVAYDPIFLTGQSTTGSATFATLLEGSTGFTATETEYGAYRYMPTITSTTSGSTTTWMISKLASAVGASETIRTAADVTTGNLVAWRTENNNLTRRMGELRSAGGEAGMWLRTYRGAEEINDGGRATEQQYTAIQGGYDRKVRCGEGGLYKGYALGYLEGDSTYNRGTGENSSLSAGAYASWLGNTGHFLDAIVKVGKLRNSYTSYLNDSANTKVDGNYKTWGNSLSVEYGYRRQMENNWYFEPQAELSYSRINGASHTASDGTRVRSDAVNSLVGRLGLAVGRHAGSSHYYGKISLAREFSADAEMTAASGAATPIVMEQGLKENWLEFALGLTTSLDKRIDGYLEFSRTTGDKIKTPWQVNAGARWNF